MWKLGLYDDDKNLMEQISEQLINRFEKEVELIRIKSEKELIDRIQEDMLQNIDILLLDIQLEHMNGIELARKIQLHNRKMKIIFMTGYMDYVQDIFEAEPTYLLIKPIDEEKLSQAVEKAIHKLETEQEQVLVLKEKGQIKRIPFNEIIYIESDKRYVHIYHGKEVEIVPMKLGELEKMLPDMFLRCHQSYMINMQRIEQFQKSQILLRDGIVIPVSRGKIDKVRKSFFRFLGEEI